MTLKALDERRSAAEAELRALDARAAEQRAAAEAEAAEQEVAQRHARARHAQFRAELDRIDEFVRQERQREHEEWSRERDRRDDVVRRFRALGNEKPPAVRRSMAEYQAELAEVDRYLDDVHLREQDALRAECDAAESRRLWDWDWDFRRRWDAQHRGRDTREGCQCALHRAWRRETPQ